MWEQIGSIEFTLTPPEIHGGWEQVGEIEFALTPPEVAGGWQKVGEIEFTLYPKGTIPPPITCKINADCPTGYKCVNGKCVKISETEIPWKWIGIGTGAVLVTALVIKALPESKEKKPKQK